MQNRFTICTFFFLNNLSKKIKPHLGLLQKFDLTILHWNSVKQASIWSSFCKPGLYILCLVKWDPVFPAYKRDSCVSGQIPDSSSLLHFPICLEEECLGNFETKYPLNSSWQTRRPCYNIWFHSNHKKLQIKRVHILLRFILENKRLSSRSTEDLVVWSLLQKCKKISTEQN